MAGLTAEALAGSLTARFGVDERGLTARVAARAPLELRGPFAADARRGGYFLRNMTAGVFGGDAHAVDVTVERGAIVCIGSSSASKVYTSGGRCASFSTRLRVEAGGLLVWGPHATIVQSGAAYRQETLVTLAAGARAVVADVLVLGRLARGERFDFERLENRFEVAAGGGGLLYSEAYELTPSEDLIASMTDRPVLASVYGLGYDASDAGQAIDGVLTCREGFAGWSRLPNGAGVVVRLLGESLHEGQSLAERVVSALDAACAGAKG